MNYQAQFEPAEEGGFVVTFPDFDFGVTQGDTGNEALEMAADALALVIESYIEQVKPLPDPYSTAAGTTAPFGCRRSRPRRWNSTACSLPLGIRKGGLGAEDRHPEKVSWTDCLTGNTTRGWISPRPHSGHWAKN